MDRGVIEHIENDQPILLNQKDRLAGRSLRNPIRCFDQAAALFRFLRQPASSDRVCQIK